MKSFKVVGTVGLLAGICLSGRATILLPGQSGLDAPQPLAGTQIFSDGTDFSFGGLSGRVSSFIIDNPANPLGGLTFEYLITSTGQEAINGFTASDFGIVPGAPVDVSSGGTGIVPSGADRSGGAGSVLSFSFSGNEILPGARSMFLVINTPYESFGVGTGSVIGVGGDSVDVAILGPVPEPSTIVAGSLLLIPLGVSILRNKRLSGKA